MTRSTAGCVHHTVNLIKELIRPSFDMWFFVVICNPVSRDIARKRYHLWEIRHKRVIDHRLQEPRMKLSEIVYFLSMMTSSNGSSFRVTGPLWGEFTDHRRIPLHKGQWRGNWCIFQESPLTHEILTKLCFMLVWQERYKFPHGLLAIIFFCIILYHYYIQCIVIFNLGMCVIIWGCYIV